MQHITVTVDGTEYQSEVEPRTLLVHCLREGLGKGGTVVGCDTSNCGACTILVDGQSYAPSRAEQPVGRWLDGRLFMSFVVRLDEAVDPRAAPVGFMSYDPMFYIDIRHPDGDGAATVEGPGSAACSAGVGRSEPAPETVASAAALDRNDTAPPGLGRLFADYVKVTCR